MYNTQNAQSAYGSIQKETLSPRSVEYRVFLQTISRLEAVHAEGDQKSTEYVTALGDNLLLWNALAADVASEGNGLPKQLKGQIFYLAQFMSKHTLDIRNGHTNLQPIIDINKMVLEGLETQLNNSLAQAESENSESNMSKVG